MEGGDTLLKREKAILLASKKDKDGLMDERAKCGGTNFCAIQEIWSLSLVGNSNSEEGVKEAETTLYSKLNH